MKTIPSTRSFATTLLGLCALVGVLVATQAFAATIRYKSSGDYFTLTNTTGNVYGWMSTALPGDADTIRLNWGNNTVTLAGVAPLINNFQCGVDESGTLVVNSGGVLTTKGAANSTIGNNSSSASGVVGRMTVNTGGLVTVTNVLFVGNSPARNVTGILNVNGGTVNVTSHLWAGSGASTTGYIYLTNGGTLNVGGNIGLGTINASTPSGSSAFLYVQDGGVLNLKQITPTNSIQPNSVMDVSGSGVIVVPSDYTAAMSYYTNQMRLTSYGGLGTVGIDYNNLNPLKTTVFAIAPAAPPPTNTVWNPAGNPSTTGHWNEATNWTAGVVPLSVTKVVFNVPDAIPCIVSNTAVAKYVVMGDNGPGGTLIITNGGTLTCTADNWSAIGYNSNALMVVENGGSANFGNHLWIGLNTDSDGTLRMNGGNVSVWGMFGLGWGGGKGTAQIYGGTLTLAQWNDFGSIVGSSVLDVGGTGKVVINGNHLLSIETYIGYGQIIANGGAGTVAVDYNHLHAGKTTIYVAGTQIPPEQTTWDPSLNPGDLQGLWNVSSNWTGALMPTNITKATFSVPDAIPCVVTGTASAGRIVMGDSGGPGGTLIVTNGASLAVGSVDWSAVAYSSNATLVVETGASATFAYQLWVGFNPSAEGSLIINGGTVSVASMFGLGWNGGKGTARVNGGTLNLAQFNATQSIGGASVLDVIGTGKVVITGDQTLSVSNYISNGKITANGGSTVYYGYDSGLNKTTISAVPLPAQPKAITAISVSGGNVTVTYQTSAGHTYRLEESASMAPGSWTTVPGSTTSATGAPVTFTFPASGTQKFYRAVTP